MLVIGGRSDIEFYNEKALDSPGCIIPWASNSIPENYLLCDGSAISRINYKRLFDIIGTIWGDGDGENTFNIPLLNNRFFRGKDYNAGIDSDGDRDIGSFQQSKVKIPSLSLSSVNHGSGHNSFFVAAAPTTFSSSIITSYQVGSIIGGPSNTEFVTLNNHSIFSLDTSLLPNSRNTLFIIKY